MRYLRKTKSRQKRSHRKRDEDHKLASPSADRTGLSSGSDRTQANRWPGYITADPNELTATVHSRMPVILKPSEYDRWLTRHDPERPPVDLLRPYDASEMTAYIPRLAARVIQLSNSCDPEVAILSAGCTKELWYAVISACSTAS